MERITQRRTACAAVRIDQDTISNVYYYTNGGLPVRIDQEVEMTDRLQELGYIYYRGCARTIQSCDGKAAQADRAVSQEDRREVRGCTRQSLAVPAMPGCSADSQRC